GGNDDCSDEDRGEESGADQSGAEDNGADENGVEESGAEENGAAENGADESGADESGAEENDGGRNDRPEEGKAGGAGGVRLTPTAATPVPDEDADRMRERVTALFERLTEGPIVVGEAGDGRPEPV